MAKNQSYCAIFLASLIALSSTQEGFSQERTLRERIKSAPGGEPVRLSVMSTRPRMTLEEVAEKSDLILHARLVGAHCKLSPDGEYIFTDYDVSPIRIVLADRPSAVPGPTRPLVVSSFGGETDVDGRRVILEDATFRPLTSGSEVVLFLQWTPALNAYIILGGPYGAFEVKNGIAEPRAVNGPESKQPISDLLRRVDLLLARRH